MYVVKNNIGEIVITKAWTFRIMYIMYNVVYNSVRSL